MQRLIAALRFIIADFKAVKVKFSDQGIEPLLVDEYLDLFKKNKNKIKELDHKNIDNWGKKPWIEFKEFVDSLIEQKSKSEEKKLTKQEGAELKAENDAWKIYKITSHKAAMLYGKGTKWCITEPDSHHWDNYELSNNFYFLISKTREPGDKWSKIAMQFERNGDITYWDATDDSHDGLSSGIRNTLPQFTPDKFQLPEKYKHIEELAAKVMEWTKANSTTQLEEIYANTKEDLLEETIGKDDLVRVLRKLSPKDKEKFKEIKNICINKLKDSPADFFNFIQHKLCDSIIVDRAGYREKLAGLELDGLIIEKDIAVKLTDKTLQKECSILLNSNHGWGILIEHLDNNKFSMQGNKKTISVTFDPNKTVKLVLDPSKFDAQLKELKKEVNANQKALDELILKSTSPLTRKRAILRTENQQLLYNIITNKKEDEKIKKLAAQTIKDPKLIDKILASKKSARETNLQILFHNKNIDPDILKQIVSGEHNLEDKNTYRYPAIQKLTELKQKSIWEWLRKTSLGKKKSDTNIYSSIFINLCHFLPADSAVMSKDYVQDFFNNLIKVDPSFYNIPYLLAVCPLQDEDFFKEFLYRNKELARENGSIITEAIKRITDKKFLKKLAADNKKDYSINGMILDRLQYIEENNADDDDDWNYCLDCNMRKVDGNCGCNYCFECNLDRDDCDCYCNECGNEKGDCVCDDEDDNDEDDNDANDD